MSEQLSNRLQAALAERYRIDSELDRGGMAVVFLADDLKHDRKVAIKVLLPSLVATLGVERFLREIEVTAKLQHPHVLTLIDSGEVDGLPYYVMPFVEGQGLHVRLESEPQLPVEEAVRIASEVADALEYAHEHGVVHRDIKPSNILLSGRHAVVADFGIAAALEHAKETRLTQTGTSVGSPVYMSPEQAGGERDVDLRTDIYSLGCVLYEMLGGSAPFADSSLKSLLAQKLVAQVSPLSELRHDVPAAVVEAVSKALATDPDDRFQSAREFRKALEVSVAGPTGGLVGGRRRALALAVGIAAIAVAAVAFALQNARGKERALRATRQIAEVERLADAGEFGSAFALAEEVERVLPNDTSLARLWFNISRTEALRSDPPGARVFRQSVDAPDDQWELLGVTPIDSVRFVRLTGYRLRFDKDGYRPVELLHVFTYDHNRKLSPDPVKLDRTDTLPAEMVRIPGFTGPDSVEYGDFFMDRFEVTNREYKRFVDSGGYQSPEYWTKPFVRDGIELDWEEVVADFEDQTGRPGPSTWRLGTHPEGMADYPVGGVSWYEAAAYARFVDKKVPSVWHWYAGHLTWRDYMSTSWLIDPRSNLGGQGPRPVGESRAMTAIGVYDLRGNVREWCYNEVGGGRATRGGAWTDASFYTEHIIPKSPFERHETHGIRLVKTFDEEGLLAVARSPVMRVPAPRDYRTETPATDAAYEIYRRLFAYDPATLNAELVRADTFELWVREQVAFDLPYGERGGAYLYLPREAPRPLQVILWWGGSGLLSLSSVDQEYLPTFDFLMKSGRAVAQPIWKGAFFRDDSLFSFHWQTLSHESSAYRDITLQWHKELARTIDYLETRSDIDAEKIGYYGLSWGGREASKALATQNRLKVAVLNVGGLHQTKLLPEIDEINFVTRVHQPVLMLSGEHDIVFPLETNQRPMFELLGTDPAHKRLHVTPTAHFVPQNELIRETLDWLDRYFGPPVQ